MGHCEFLKINMLILSCMFHSNEVSFFEEIRSIFFPFKKKNIYANVILIIEHNFCQLIFRPGSLSKALINTIKNNLTQFTKIF